MNLAFFVYLSSVVSGLKILLVVPAVFAVIVCLVGSMIMYVETGNKFKYLKHCLIASGISLFVATLIPSEKAMYMMAGAYAAQSVYESPDARRISGKIIDLIDQKLDEEIKNVKEKK